MTGTADLAMIGIGCAEPRALADFYRRALGWRITGASPDHATIQGDGVPIVFWRVEEEAPRWPSPDSAKQFHLSFAADDLDAAEARCVKLGATKPAFQPGDEWRVLIDPAGHPFCITPARRRAVS
jgi:catechol 2,3-dioxygenase-like lactoylglutathione lyase family enzyme